MLRIRLARTGKKKQASYRVVVAEKSRAVQAKFIEILGWYNPHTKELNIQKEKIEGWLGKGASPSNTVAVLLKKSGFKLPDWVKIKEKKKKKKEKKGLESEETEAKPQKEGGLEAEIDKTKEETSPKQEVENPENPERKGQEEKNE